MVWMLLVDNIGTPFSSFTHEDPNFVKGSRIRLESLLTSYPLSTVGEDLFFFLYMDHSCWRSTEFGRYWYMTWEYSKRLGSEAFHTYRDR